MTVMGGNLWRFDVATHSQVNHPISSTNSMDNMFYYQHNGKIIVGMNLLFLHEKTSHNC